MRVKIEKTSKGELTIREFCPTRKSVISLVFTVVILGCAVLVLLPATVVMGAIGGILAYVTFWATLRSKLATKVVYSRGSELSYALPGAVHTCDTALLEQAYASNAGLLLELLAAEDSADSSNVNVNKSGFTFNLVDFQDHVASRTSAERKAADLREQLAL